MTMSLESPRRWGFLDPYVAVVGVVSLVTFALHGLTGSLSRDLSVYTYAGQQVADGHPPYLGILNRAGPLSHLFPALGVGIARIVGIDDLVGARLLFMGLSVLCVCTAYLLGRDLFGSALVGLVTAATFLSFQGFIEYASNGPREKTPMMLFILLALWAMVHRRWFSAGLCVSLATLTLQIGFFAAAPAVLVALLLAPGEVGRIRALLRFVAGGLAPVLVFVGYFALVGALKEAVDAFLVLNFRYSTSNPLTDEIAKHVTKLKEGYGVTLWFMLVGLTVLVVLSFAIFSRKARHEQAWVVPVTAMGVATVVAVFWTVRDLDSWPDAFTVLPLAAVGIGALVALVTAPLPRPLRFGSGLAWVGLATVLALVFSVNNRSHVLVDQRNAVTAALAQLPADATIATVNAPQPLVLSGRRNPTRFMMFTGGLDQYMDDTWPGGLRQFGRDLDHGKPTLVAMGVPSRVWLKKAVKANYVRVGKAPGWVWFARTSLGPAELTRLRDAIHHPGRAAQKARAGQSASASATVRRGR